LGALIFNKVDGSFVKICFTLLVSEFLRYSHAQCFCEATNSLHVFMNCELLST
jgi:hypothetical protein